MLQNALIYNTLPQAQEKILHALNWGESEPVPQPNNYSNLTTLGIRGYFFTKKAACIQFSSNEEIYNIDFNESADLPVKPTSPIDILKTLYSIKDIASVQKFIDKHFTLYKLLQEVQDKIKDVFGKDIKGIHLEYFSDPEEDFQFIYIKIDTDLSIDNEFRLMDKFLENYWLYKDASTRMLVNVMV